MPNAAPAAGAGTPVAGDHSNATEISAPVVEEDITTPLDESSQLGSHREEPEEAEAEVVETTETDEPEVVAPARLKGKTLAQVYQEFAGLEKEYSRQGNELGEARGLLRQALEQALTPGAKTNPEPDLPDPTDDEFISDPKGAAKKIIEKELKPLKDAVLSAEQRAAMLEFEARRPGYQKEVADPKFQEWVKAKPSRMRLFQRAAQFDLEAADDMFEMWDVTKPAAEAANPAEQKKAAIKRVTTETGGAGKSAGGKSGKKIYKSTELARLYINDRDRYNDMADEIRAAYEEGRVR